MRRKFIVWLAQMLGVQIYLEILPVTPGDFRALVRLNPDIRGIPQYINWDIFNNAVWPRPSRQFKLFIQ